jgi:Ca2+/Na+ antiporter
MSATAVISLVNLKRKWVLLNLLFLLGLSLAIALVLAYIAVYFFAAPYWILVLLFIMCFAVLTYWRPYWKLSQHTISRYLDQRYPEMEESTALLFKDDRSLSLLERFQRQKVMANLPVLELPAVLFKKLLYTGFALLLIMVLGWLLIINPQKNSSGGKSTTTSNAAIKPIKENIPPKVTSVLVNITPPAYTGLSPKKQSLLNIRAEMDASVSWQINTSLPLENIKFIFNEKETVIVNAADQSGTVFKLSRKLSRPGFYQLNIAGIKSDLYQLDLIHDLPVRIKVNSPKPRTTIDYGQLPQVNLKVDLQDDYGIDNAFISVTMASGKGEGVSFTEKKIPFKAVFNKRSAMQLSEVLHLTSLGLKPGDELYFFVQAFDTRGQSSRSEVHFVSMVDTAELMSMTGMANGLNLVPEYFRSQRQIIIDTEQLLKEKSSITEQVFKNRSNNLGIDQKLLRLRYGKFLGEESEGEIGPDDDHGEGEEHHDHDGHDHGETPKFGDTKAIMDSYAHNHDVAEDATFFEPELKAQLKAVLTEMWNSELRLRTFKPQEALPYEYKALRLFKDLQQKSRAYVAKTSVKMPPLKEEKRLSGELDKIGEPLRKNTYTESSQRTALLKNTLGILEKRKTGQEFQAADYPVLQAAEQEMIVAAATHPATFLPALKQLRRVRDAKKVVSADIQGVQKAILKMMPSTNSKPQQAVAAPASALYQSYFNQLNQRRP